MSRMKFKLFCLCVGSFIISIAPLATVLIARWGEYTQTPNDTVKLCFGALLGIIFVALKTLGKLKIPSRIILFLFVFLMSYLLQALLQDLILLSGMALAGECLDFVFFQRAIRNMRENILVEKTADTTSEKVEAVLKKYIGRV